MHDPIADFFLRIKNAQAIQRADVVMPISKMKESIANVLLSSGYVTEVKRVPNKPVDMLEITLKYDDKKPAISEIRRVSKPGSRRYSGVQHLPRPLSGHGLVILSTPKGVMSGADAQKAGIGGEVIATVW